MSTPKADAEKITVADLLDVILQLEAQIDKRDGELRALRAQLGRRNPRVLRHHGDTTFH